MLSKANSIRVHWPFAVASIVLFVSMMSLSAPTGAEIGFPGEEESLTDEVDLDSSLEASFIRGKAVYDGKCAFCHRADGMGIPEAFPPLVKGAKFDADPKIIDPLKQLGLYENGAMTLGTVEVQIDVVLNGIPGTRMFAFESQLTTQQAADVITYIRNAWSNHSGDVVTPEQIEAALKKK